MPRYLILAQSEVTANALGVWLNLLGEKPLNENDPSRIVWDHPAGRQGTVAAYETLVRRIEIAARDGDDHVPLNQVHVLVDSISPAGLSAVEESGGWENLVAMLILTFPEIRWVFGVRRGVAALSCPIESHSLVALFNLATRDPLLDPTGLRDWVRELTNAGLNTASDDLRLPNRALRAVAVDEEKPYAYLHGYTAYRFGLVVDVVTSWKLMESLFHRTDPSKSHGYWLLLEDMSLNFADRERGKHLLSLEAYDEEKNGEVIRQGRSIHCNLLESSKGNIEHSDYRVLITTGQTRPGDDVLNKNRTYLRQKAYGCGRVIFKPASGMFDLWEKVGLYRKQRGSGRLGNVGKFSWPPPPVGPILTDNKKAEGHGAPGKLMLVAEALIRRAEALLGKVTRVEEAVQGAVLATDALELTGGRTPTTAIEALALKHQFEVLAECQFSGVEYHLKITTRLHEIGLETEAICRWFHKSERHNAKLNAEMHILNALVRILRAHGQFDEEQLCMHRIRHLHGTLWMRARPWRYVFLPFIRYVELLLKSFLGFVGVVLVWLVVLSILFAVFPAKPSVWNIERLLIGMENAVSAFFSMGPPMQHGIAPLGFSLSYVLVSALCIIASFLHLGVLVSHLYAVVSRR